MSASRVFGNISAHAENTHILQTLLLQNGKQEPSHGIVGVGRHDGRATKRASDEETEEEGDQFDDRRRDIL